LRGRFQKYDANQRFPFTGEPAKESPECISGLILQGLKKPHECPAFAVKCTPENPLGAPMVSSEGACAAYYHYGRRQNQSLQPELSGSARR
jgi:hydrogenase expression/formation protein HypD